jgi:hypothetical protein
MEIIMTALFRNPAADIYPVFAGGVVAATAGGAGAAAAAAGTAIDLTALPDRFEAVAFTIAATATLAATKSLTVAAKIETSSDNTNWSDLTTSATVLSLTSTAGDTQTGAAVLDVSLEYASRYVRLNFTPDLSATGTDTASISRTALFTGRRKQS